MANKQRGEVEVRLGGRTWTMRPTFQAIAEIEDRTGLGMVELVVRFSDGRFGVTHMTAVIWAGIHAAHDDAPDFDEVGEMVVKHGIQRLAVAVGAFLATVLSGVQEQPAPARKVSRSGKAA